MLDNLYPTIVLKPFEEVMVEDVNTQIRQTLEKSALVFSIPHGDQYGQTHSAGFLYSKILR